MTDRLDDFCYLGSLTTVDNICDKYIKTCIKKANADFGET